MGRSWKHFEERSVLSQGCHERTVKGDAAEGSEMRKEGCGEVSTFLETTRDHIQNAGSTTGGKM